MADGGARRHRSRRPAPELAPGRWPTRRQYDDAFEELGLRHRGAEVAELWNGRWRQAVEEWAGRSAYESEAARDLRTRALRLALRDPDGRVERALDGLRRWLATNPTHRTQRAYTRWARARNAEGEDPPVPGYDGVRNSLAVTFAQAVRVAAGELDLAEARARTTQDRAGPPGPWVELSEAARLLGCAPSMVYAHVEMGRLPPAVKFGRTRGAYLTENVLAFRDGRAIPRPDGDQVRREWLNGGEVAELIGMSHEAVQGRVARRDWRLMMPPTYHGARLVLWRRSDFEEWLAGRES